ncbi:MAG: glycosyltransferase family 4 protein [Thermoproteota archaeon]
MRILMLSWEYPPRKIGGLATHVYELTKALSEMAEVHVVTCSFPGAPDTEIINGTFVHRVNVYQAPSPDFLIWTMLMNINLLKASAELVAEERFDVMHCHDWLVAPACITLKHATGGHLVATIHSTESGRRHGIHTDYQRVINEIEGWLTYEASRVVCCSWSMVGEVASLFNVPRDKIWMIPNGIDTEIFKPNPSDDLFRRRFAGLSEKIILYVGRLVPEKGVNVLIGSVPKILSANPNVKFVIVGEGYDREHLSSLAKYLGVDQRIYFTGYISDEEIKKLLSLAYLQIVPSLYEPFGIVCLEAAASGVPVVASDIGGLSELVEDGVTGLKVPPDNSDAIAYAVNRILSDEVLRESMSKKARERAVERFSIKAMAERTMEMYSSF